MIKFFNQKKNDVVLNNFKKYFKKDLWVNGNIVEQCELKIRNYLKLDHNVITCNSGSDALLLSLLLSQKKNKKKDIYITTPISYLASASIPKFLNLNLIYVDVEKDNFIISLDKLENFLLNCPKKIKKRINGIINVELFGYTCDLVKLSKIAKKHKLNLIGDCAQSFGTKYKNISSMDFYDYAATSFYPTKLLSCYGDGGALFFKEKYKDVFLLKNNGHSKKEKINCEKIGINSRLDSIQAFVLISELKKLNRILNKRKQINNFYNKKLKKNIKRPKILDNNIKANNYIYPLLIEIDKQKKFKKLMERKNIEFKKFYSKLLPENKLLKPIINTNLSNSKKTVDTMFCIPNHEHLTIKNRDDIIEVLNKL